MNETLKIQKMCGAKKRYITKERAENAKTKLCVNTGYDKRGEVVNVYQCPYCHYWHVGRPRNQVKAKESQNE